MKPELIYVLYKLDRLFSDSLPDIAIDLINRGIENEYIIEIAGMTKPSQDQLGDLVEKGFASLIDINFDFLKMAIVIAKGINENEIDPYKGAFLIGEISEKLDRLPELWDFKCNIIQYDDYEQDKGVSNLGYNSENIIIWQNEIIEDIKKSAKLLIDKYNQ